MSSAVVRIPGFEVAERPRFSGDFLFWQYPALTEKQAYENHLALSRRSTHPNIINLYLGLPWATFIDRKVSEGAVFETVRDLIAYMRKDALGRSSRLRVHTVCQHIHWRRLIPLWNRLGVTDVHLSHYTPRAGYILNLEGLGGDSWPLFAPNVELSENQIGLDPGVPIAERKYVASFVGAYMPHYIDESRLAIARYFSHLSDDRFAVSIRDKWHFNDLVYIEQVKESPLDFKTMAEDKGRTFEYNETLSNTIFSLCPSGAGPNSLRLWESLAIGCIPVLFSRDWVIPKRMHGTVNPLIYFEDLERLDVLIDMLCSLAHGRVKLSIHSEHAKRFYLIGKRLTCFD